MPHDEALVPKPLRGVPNNGRPITQSSQRIKYKLIFIRFEIQTPCEGINVASLRVEKRCQKTEQRFQRLFSFSKEFFHRSTLV